MYDRAKYKAPSDKIDWRTIPDPVGMVKWDGANFFMPVESDGSLKFFSRRESVKGGFPERTSQLPHLTGNKLPQFAGNVYNVELIHTGHDPDAVESHRATSGILNSLTERSIQTQKELGPIRVKIHNVVSPELTTFKDKLLHMKSLQDTFGKPEIFSVVEPHVGHVSIHKLIAETKRRNQEGVIITSLSLPEDRNTRVKIKHILTYNLLVAGMEEERDKAGNPKGAMGALILVDRSGKEVARVGTGFTRQVREEIWANKSQWIGRLIQVKTMGLSAKKLRMPVFNGDADGELDLIQ